MTRDDIIRMAREAGFNEIQTNAMVFGAILERFAALVAAAEREACAKVCEAHHDYTKAIALNCATTIRARGQA